jgi:hypothetical protein
MSSSSADPRNHVRDGHHNQQDGNREDNVSVDVLLVVEEVSVDELVDDDDGDRDSDPDPPVRPKISSHVSSIASEPRSDKRLGVRERRVT